MFIRSDLGEAQKPTPVSENRVIGAVVLIAAIAILLLVALTADASISTALNANDRATQTSQAQNPLFPPGHPPIPSNPRNQNSNPSPVKFSGGRISPNGT